MQINILLFATLRDPAGVRNLNLHIAAESLTVADLRRDLTERYPHMADNLAAASVAINEEFAFDADAIQ